MKNKKILYAITCVLGSGMIGFFAKYLNELYGSILFIIGVILMTCSIVKLSK